MVCEFAVPTGQICCAITGTAEMAFVSSLMNSALRPNAASTAGSASGIRLRPIPRAVRRASRTILVVFVWSIKSIMDWIVSEAWRQASDMALSHDVKNWAIAIAMI